VDKLIGMLNYLIPRRNSKWCINCSNPPFNTKSFILVVNVKGVGEVEFIRRVISLILLILLIIVTVTGVISWLLPGRVRGKHGLTSIRRLIIIDVHAWVGVVFLAFCIVHIYLNRGALKQYLGLERKS